MQNLNSSNAKSRKLFYYLQSIPLVFFLPSIISRLSLQQILKNNNLKREYIESRVKYYLKTNANFEVSKKSKNASELLWSQISKNKQNSHFIDFYLSLLILKVLFCFYLIVFMFYLFSIHFLYMFDISSTLIYFYLILLMFIKVLLICIELCWFFIDSY